MASIPLDIETYGLYSSRKSVRTLLCCILFCLSSCSIDILDSCSCVMRTVPCCSMVLTSSIPWLWEICRCWGYWMFGFDKLEQDLSWSWAHNLVAGVLILCSLWTHARHHLWHALNYLSLQPITQCGESAWNGWQCSCLYSVLFTRRHSLYPTNFTWHVCISAWHAQFLFLPIVAANNPLCNHCQTIIDESKRLKHLCCQFKD